MILELDLGNTRAKWRVIKEDAGVVAQGIANIVDWFEGGFPEVWGKGIKRVRIASVLLPETENKLIAKIQTELLIFPQIAKSTSHCCGVTSAYENPERLGVDRWMALIAARQMLGRAALVIDVGTALKVDAIDGAGHHVGGYIIPGASLMERALFDGTERVRYAAGQCIESMVFGHDTRSCVQNGIAAALTGAVLVAIKQYREIIGKSPALLITGGLGQQLKGCLESAGVRDLRFEADLVLDGLRWALP